MTMFTPGIGTRERSEMRPESWLPSISAWTCTDPFKVAFISAFRGSHDSGRIPLIPRVQIPRVDIVILGQAN